MTCPESLYPQYNSPARSWRGRRNTSSPAVLAFALLAAVCLAAGCATFNPVPLDEIGYTERIATQAEGDVTVSVAVLTKEETKQAFGLNLARRGIQPVWLRIENEGPNEFIFLPTDLDRNYFSAGEAAWKGHRPLAAERNERILEHFTSLAVPPRIQPESTVEGFVHTNRDEGVKYLNVTLFRPGLLRSTEFVVEVPGVDADYQAIDFEALAAEYGVVELDDTTLRQALESLPATTLGPDLKTPGDPLNLVVIGDQLRAFLPFVRSGWDVTETLSGGSVWRTIRSSLFRRSYRTSPVSPLFVFGRPQDLALQKARATVDERNHLRMWLTPYRYKGLDVWVGQISRDIGVRFSRKTFVTHKIDPQVDEARSYLVQDIGLTGGLKAVGLIGGVGVYTRDAPGFNYTGDPYYTDGQRAVLIVSEDYVEPDEVQVYE